MNDQTPRLTAGEVLHKLAADLQAQYPDRDRYCGPAHLCDSMSGCRNGAAHIIVNGVQVPARFADCYRYGDTARLYVYPYPERPAFAVRVAVPVEMVAP